MSDVFISYSRKDQGFVKRLFDVLAEQGREAWVDWQGIPPTAEWLAEVYAAIDAANAFIFVITPDSANSEICQLEVSHAVRQNKRLVPILLKDVESHQLHEDIGKINWLKINDENIGSSMDSLLSALDTDLDWVRDHTRLIVRESEWGQHDREDSRLLRGKDLDGAEQWLAVADGKSPSPTTRQSFFITASRQAANRRQRRLLGGITVGLVVAIGLAIFAWLQRDIALDEATRAKSNLLSSQAVFALDNDHDPTRSFHLAADAWQLNPENSMANSLMFRSQYGEGTFVYRGNRYRPPLYREIDTNIDFSGVHLSPDGQHLALIAYRQDTGESETHIVDLEGNMRSSSTGRFITFSEAGNYFLTTDFKTKTGSVWDIDGNAVAKEGAYFKMMNQSKGTFKVANENGKYSIAPVPVDRRLASQKEKVIRSIKPWTFVEGDPGISMKPGTSRDGALIAAYDSKHQYRIWDMRGKVVANFPAQNDLITSADFSPDRQYLAVSMSTGDIIIWNLTADKKLQISEYENKLATLRGHSDTAYSVEFTPDGESLITTARDGTIKIWNLTSLPVPQLIQSTKNARSIIFRPEQDRVLTTNYSSVDVWDYDGNRQLAVAGYFTSGLINSVAVSHSAEQIAVVNGKTLKIHSVDSDSVLEIPAHQHNILAVSFSLTDRFIVTSDSQLIKIWDQDGNSVTSLDFKSKGGSVYNNQWKPYFVDINATPYFLIQAEKNILLLDQEGNEIKSVSGRLGSGMMDRDMFSSDRKYVIISRGDHGLSVFDLEKMEVIASADKLPEHDNFQIARFTAQTNRIYAVIEYRGGVYLWDWLTDELRIAGAPYQLESAQVLPSRELVITKAIDGMIRFTKLDGSELFTIENRAAGWAKLSPTGDYLALLNHREKGWPVELWSIGPEILINQTRQINTPDIEN